MHLAMLLLNKLQMLMVEYGLKCLLQKRAYKL